MKCFMNSCRVNSKASERNFSFYTVRKQSESTSSAAPESLNPACTQSFRGVSPAVNNELTELIFNTPLDQQCKHTHTHTLYDTRHHTLLNSSILTKLKYQYSQPAAPIARKLLEMTLIIFSFVLPNTFAGKRSCCRDHVQWKETHQLAGWRMHYGGWSVGSGILGAWRRDSKSGHHWLCCLHYDSSLNNLSLSFIKSAGNHSSDNLKQH